MKPTTDHGLLTSTGAGSIGVTVSAGGTGSAGGVASGAGAATTGNGVDSGGVLTVDDDISLLLTEGSVDVATDCPLSVDEGTAASDDGAGLPLSGTDCGDDSAGEEVTVSSVSREIGISFCSKANHEKTTS